MLRVFRRAEHGSEIVEFGLILLPLLAVLFLIVDISWLIFAQATIQHAAEEGVRYAITSPVPTGLDAAIKNVVQQNAMGFLAGSQGLQNISIDFYSPANLTKPVTGAGSTAGGNVVQVSIANVSISPLGPILRSTAAVTLSAKSSDVMESPPNGVPSTQ